MKCLKCLNPIKKVSHLKVNELLSHVSNWGVCSNCLDISVGEAKEKIHKYYIDNKNHYRKLHKGYKSKLTNSYVANALVDRTNLKAKDIPQVLVEAKRQHMKINRIVKERTKHGKETNKRF